MIRPDGLDPLGLVAELSSSFASTGELEATLVAAVERIAEQVGAEGGALLLFEEEGRVLVCRACTGPVRITGLRLAADQGIVGRCCRDDSLELVRDVREDPNWEPAVDAETGFTTRSILCAPLRVHDQRLGAIELVNKQSGDGLFSEEDGQLLAALAASAALALHNARMARALVERERLAREVELAAEIQRSMLPDPRPAPFPIVGANVPARGVSGDFYDWLDLRGGERPRIPFCVGDVSGKGTNAALLMAKTASLFRCIAREEPSPGAILARLNSELVETATRGMFVTLAVGCLERGEGAAFDRVRLALAGHPPAFHGAEGKPLEAIESGGPPLGIGPVPAGFPEVTLSFPSGALYLFTDGATDVRDEAGEELGLAGIERAIHECASLPIRERLTELVQRTTHEGRAGDDVTWLIVSAEPPAQESLLTHRFAARAEALGEVRRRVLAACRAVGAGGDCSHDVVLAVDEACQNVIRHAYRGADGEIELTILRDGGDLVVYLRDFAERVDPSRIRPRRLEDVRPGGLGTHFIQELMDEREYGVPETGEGNLLRMKKRIQG